MTADATMRTTGETLAPDRPQRQDPEAVARGYLMGTIAELHLAVANQRAQIADLSNRIVDAEADNQKLRLERNAALARLPKAAD